MLLGVVSVDGYGKHLLPEEADDLRRARTYRAELREKLHTARSACSSLGAMRDIFTLVEPYITAAPPPAYVFHAFACWRFSIHCYVDARTVACDCDEGDCDFYGYYGYHTRHCATCGHLSRYTCHFVTCRALHEANGEDTRERKRADDHEPPPLKRCNAFHEAEFSHQ